MLRKIHLLGKPWRTFMRKAIWFLYGHRSKQKINECNNGWEIFLHWLHLLSSLPYWHKGTNSGSLWLTRKFTKRFCRTRGNDKSRRSLKILFSRAQTNEPESPLDEQTVIALVYLMGFKSTMEHQFRHYHIS